MKWLNKKDNKYTSNTIQAEITEIIAHQILRSIIEKIKAVEFFGKLLVMCISVFALPHCSSTELKTYILCFKL